MAKRVANHTSAIHFFVCVFMLVILHQSRNLIFIVAPITDLKRKISQGILVTNRRPFPSFKKMFEMERANRLARCNVSIRVYQENKRCCNSGLLYSACGPALHILKHLSTDQTEFGFSRHHKDTPAVQQLNRCP